MRQSRATAIMRRARWRPFGLAHAPPECGKVKLPALTSPTTTTPSSVTTLTTNAGGSGGGPSALAALHAQVQAQAARHQQQLDISQQQLQMAIQQRTTNAAADAALREEREQEEAAAMMSGAGPLTGSTITGGGRESETEMEMDRQQQQRFQQQQQERSSSNSTMNPLIPFLASTGATSSSDFVNPGAMQQGGELGRATLMQMSEMSRRAATMGGLAGWAGEQVQPPGRGRDVERGQQAEYQREDSRRRESMDVDGSSGQQRWYDNGASTSTANNAAGPSSSNGPSSNNANAASSSSGRNNGLMSINLSGLQGMQGFGGLGELGGLMMMGENAEASAMHEGLQVYTVGHLMPRGSYEQEEMYNAPSGNARASGSGSRGTGSRDANTNASGSGDDQWSFDTSGLAAGGMLGGLGIAQQQQQQRYQEQQAQQQQQQQGRGRSSDEEDEMVQPSINTTDENGDLVVQNSSNTLPGSASATSPRTSQAHASSSSSAQARRDIGNEEPLSISTPGVLANSRRTNTGAGSATDGKPTIRVRRSTFVPGWAVPPRVLLVDDDAVSRKLSSKFLQVFGCTTDIAVDGVGAVNKMNLEKYDLVLMDIVMPKLDGVSATSIIRKFDKGTPIISMTSNSKPNEIMTYYSSGMNDILPKPFTKQGLLDMLEKHLMHLKVIQQMQRNIPRGPGVPPLSDFNFEQALAMGGTMGLGGLGMGSNMGGMGMGIPLGLPGPGPSSSQQQQQQLMQLQQNQQQGMDQQGQGQQAFGFYGQEQNGEDAGLDNRINPLAGMGLSDEQFIMMAQMVNSGDGGGEGFMGGMSNYSSGGRNAAASGSGQQSQGSGQNPSQNQGRGGATMMYGVGINFGMSDSPPSGGGTKRGLEDGSDMDGPMGKKSRFEVIE